MGSFVRLQPPENGKALEKVIENYLSLIFGNSSNKLENTFPRLNMTIVCSLYPCIFSDCFAISADTGDLEFKRTKEPTSLP